MSEYKWATIVYGRTYEVDFRFLTIPDDFNDERITWARKYINSTTRYPQSLPQRPCWSLFQDDKHCVVGVACMVKELLGDSLEENSEDLTKDMYGRDLFVFVGYVAHIPHPSIPSMNLELFKELYNNYVRPKWNDKSYEVRNIEKEGKNFSHYEKSFDLDNCTKASENLPKYSFNVNNDRKFIWSVDANENLWYVASQQNQPISICLGLLRKRHFIDGEFLNGTAVDVSGDDKYINPEELQKPKETQYPVIQRHEELDADSHRQSASSNSSSEGIQERFNNSEDYLSGDNEHENRSKKIKNIPQSQKKSTHRDNAFYEKQLTYVRSVVGEFSHFLEDGIERTKQTFEKKKQETENSIHALKDLIDQDSFSESPNSSLFKNLNQQINQIIEDFEEIKRGVYDFCGLSEKADVSSHKNNTQDTNHQLKPESQNIEIDYGFKEKSDKNNSEPKKKWF